MDTGLRVHRNYFGIKFGTQFDARYGELYPVFRKIMYPGDVFIKSKRLRAVSSLSTP